MPIVDIEQDLARGNGRANPRGELEAAIEAAMERVDLLAWRRQTGTSCAETKPPRRIPSAGVRI